MKEKDKVINLLLERIATLEYEVERLQRQKEELQVNGLRQETLFKLEIERLNNIIKEVREYVKNLREDDEYLEELHFSYDDKYKLLEILDKEKDNE